jgi:hypothetical protein
MEREDIGRLGAMESVAAVWMRRCGERRGTGFDGLRSGYGWERVDESGYASGECWDWCPSLPKGRLNGGTSLSQHYRIFQDKVLVLACVFGRVIILACVVACKLLHYNKHRVRV